MLLLVRHAKAGARHAWTADDRLRPLSDDGWEQARGFVSLLAPHHPVRLLSSPYVRCVQSLEPLGEACHLDVEHVDELAEGRAGKAVQLTRKLVKAGAKNKAVVLCTHGDIVPEILRYAEEQGVELGNDVRWPKGCIWVLDTKAGHIVSATYVPPPTAD